MAYRYKDDRRFISIAIILINVFYFLLILTVISALIDLVLSTNPRKGIDELDSASRITSAIGLGMPIALGVAAILKLERFGKFTYFGVLVVILFLTSVVIVPAQRGLIQGLVDQSTTKQRSEAIGALIGLHAISNGALIMPRWGIDKLDRSNPQMKTAAIYLVPFLALSGSGDDFLSQSGEIFKKSVTRDNEARKDEIQAKLTPICEKVTGSHSKYFAFTKYGQRGGFIGNMINDKYVEMRDKQLGYTGSLPVALSYEEFIRHTDIQQIIREEVSFLIDDVSMSTQLLAIVERHEIQSYLLRFLDRKFVDPCTSWEQYRLDYVVPAAKDLGEKAGDLVINQDWENHPKREEIDFVGEKAIYAVIAPPLGIVWLLIAATSTIALVGYRLVSKSTGKPIVAICTALMIVFLALTLPFLKHNPYLEHPETKVGFQAIAQNYSQPVSTLFEWSMRSAPMVYSLGRLSRDAGIGLIFGLNIID